MTNFIYHPASFRDPSGFVFQAGGILYRQVNASYAGDYELLMRSGLYQALLEKRMILAHAELDINFTGLPDWYKTLRPEEILSISYPYEWSFDMLKDAALLSLAINRKAIEYGMILKDAASYNVQFHQGRPVFIDSLSFQKYDPQKPWIAYRQFCEMFLFPLFLAHYVGEDFQKLLSIYLDGVPAHTAAAMLPLKSRFRLSVWLHVYLQNTVRSKNTNPKHENAFNEKKMRRLVDHLDNTVRHLTWKRPRFSAWNNYYEETILGKDYLSAKEKVFLDLVDKIPFDSVLDIGCNDGYFSKLLARSNKRVIAIDSDPDCINRLYHFIRQKQIDNLLPLCVDICNPSPALGLDGRERAAFTTRIKTDMLLGLALLHHLAIGKNIPLKKIASIFSKMAGLAIIEFIPKSDEKLQLLLANKQDIYPDYNEAMFREAFASYYEIISTTGIPGSSRSLYLFKRK